MKNSLLKLALESEELVVVDPQSAEDAVTDVLEKSDIQDEQNEEIEEAIVAATALEELIAAIEPEEGQVIEQSKTADKILIVAVEQIFERLGHPTPTFMALEAEGGIDLNGKLARLKDFLVKLWQRIVEAFSNIYDAISDFLSTAFNAATRLEKAAVAMLRDSRALNGPPRRSTYNNKDMARRLSGDDTVGLIKLFDRTLDLTETTVQIAYGEPANILIDVIDSYSNSVHQDSTSTTPHAGGHSYDALVKQLPQAMHSAYVGKFMRKDQSPVNVHDVPEGVDVFTTPILMGSYAGILSLPQNVDTLREFSFKILPVTDDTGGSDDVETAVPVSDVRQQEDLLKMVIANCGQIRRFNRNLPALKKLDAQLKKSLSIMKSQNTSKMDREIEEESRAVVRIIAQVAPRIAQGIHHKTLAHALNASRTVLKHVQYSIHAYEGNQVS